MDSLIFKYDLLSHLSISLKKKSKISFILWGITLNKIKKQFASKTFKGESVYLFESMQT